MLFGEYLVAKNYVSHDDLLGALLDQIRAMPPEIEVLYKQGILTAEQGLQVLVAQSEGNIEFRGAMTLLGLWKSEWGDLILGEMAKNRVPIGQLLIKRGAVSAETLAAALDDYFREKKKLKQQALLQKAHATASEAQGTLEHVFSEELYFDINADLLMLESADSAKERHTLLSHLGKSFQTLQAWQDLAKHAFFGQILGKMMALCESWQGFSGALPWPTSWQGALEHLKSAVTFLWRLRQAICTQGNEGAVSGNPDLMKEFADLLYFKSDPAETLT